MTQYVINIGTIPNDGTGDPLRTAFNEVNLNFDQVFAAGPVLSNIQIANNTILTTNTNGNLVLAPNGVGVVQANVNLVPNTSNIRNLGAADRRWSTLYIQYANISGSITVGDLTATGNVTVGGNVSVTGNVINIGNIVTDAKTIQLANTAGTANAANGSGITVGANDAIATMLYSSASNSWVMNIGIDTPNIVVNNISSDDSTFVTVQEGLDVQGDITAEIISVTGNVTGNYILGNAAFMTGLPTPYANANAVAYGQAGWAGNIVPAVSNTYSLGNSSLWWSNIWVAGNTIYIGGVALGMGAGNVLTVGGNAVLQNDSNTTISTTGNITTGNVLTGGVVSATGNVRGANFNTVGLISATGNVTGNYFLGNGSQLTSLPAPTVTQDITSNGSMSIMLYDGVIKYNNYATVEPSSGNITGGNILTGGLISATGNIRGNYFIGNGSQLSGLSTSSISNGNSNVAIATANGNVTITAAGVETWTFDTAGNLTVPGNIIPQANVTYSLGDATHQWKDLYVSGNTIYFNNVPVSMDGNTLSVDGRPLYPGVEVGQPGNVVLDSPINANGPFPDIPVVIDQVTLQLADPSYAYLRWGHIPGIYTPTMSGGTSGNITNIVITNPGLYPLTDANTWPTVNTDNMFALPSGTDISDYANIWAAYQVYVSPYGPLAANIASTTTTVAEDGFIYLTANTGLAPTAQGNGMVLTVNTGAGPLNWTFDSTGNLTLPGNTSSINYANGDPYGGSGVAGLPLANGTSDFNIATANGNATVTTAGTHTWTLDDTGNLLLPLGGIVYETSIPGGVLTGNTIALKPQGGTDADQQLLIYPTALGADANHLHLTSGNLYNTELFLGNDDLYVKLANTGNILINSNDGAGNTAQWTFDITGNLNTPGGMIISGNVNTLGTQTALLQSIDDLPLSFIASGANGTVTSFWAEDFANLMTSNIAAIYTPLQNTQTVRIVTGSNGGNVAIYDFDPDGMFTAAAVCATGNVYAGNVSASGNVTGGNLRTAGIVSATGNVTGGNLITAGSGGAITMTGGNITGANVVTANVFSATGNITGNYILGNGSQLTGLPATYSNANVATFLAAYGSNTISTSGNVTAGNFVGNGAALTNVTVSVAGNIIGTQSNVTLVAGAYSTVFDNTGNLVLPGNTFAVNYANNTPVDVVTRFESSWTVPVGNSTQSFTVTASNTYYMWVDCNIPNGILVWNATGTVTNTNVPVVGYQYAWVYNGGGTPIDFTSIPNQFIGTANTIVRSNVAPSSTTNRFDFGINNTSGGNVTVRYGWIQIS